MSDKIYLRVPSKIEHEYVSVGNHSVALEPGGVVTVDHRPFADWLVREYALAEVDKPAAKKSRKSRAKAAKPKVIEKTEATGPSKPAVTNPEEGAK